MGKLNKITVRVVNLKKNGGKVKKQISQKLKTKKIKKKQFKI